MTAALEGFEWSAARPSPLYSRERPATHFTGNLMVVYVNLTKKKTKQPRGLRNVVPPAFDAVVSIVK